MNSKSYTLEANDSSSYENGYNIFLRRSDFREKVLQAFSERSSKKGENSSNLKVLDFGCGNGEMTQQYVRAIQNKQSKNELFLVEPATQSLSSAFKLLKDEFHIAFCGDQVPEGEYFDFIIASYVFYHLPAEMMNKLVFSLNQRGILSIMMGTNENPFKTHPGLRDTSKHGSSNKLDPFINSLSSFNNFTINRIKVDTSLDLTGLQEDKELTEEGKMLLSFSLNKEYSSLSAQAIDAVKDIYAEAFNKNEGKVKSVHEIIWIERLK